jgi:hypothetical protein
MAKFEITVIGVEPGTTKVQLIRGGKMDAVYEVGGFETVKSESPRNVSPEQFTKIALGKTQDSAAATASNLRLGLKALDCTYTSENSQIVIDGKDQGSGWYVLAGEGKFGPYPKWQTDTLYVSDVPFSDLGDWAAKLWNIRSVEAKEIFRIFGTLPDGSSPGAIG